MVKASKEEHDKKAVEHLLQLGGSSAIPAASTLQQANKERTRESSSVGSGVRMNGGLLRPPLDAAVNRSRRRGRHTVEGQFDDAPEAPVLPPLRATARTGASAYAYSLPPNRALPNAAGVPYRTAAANQSGTVRMPPMTAHPAPNQYLHPGSPAYYAVGRGTTAGASYFQASQALHGQFSHLAQTNGSLGPYPERRKPPPGMNPAPLPPNPTTAGTPGVASLPLQSHHQLAAPAPATAPGFLAILPRPGGHQPGTLDPNSLMNDAHQFQAPTRKRVRTPAYGTTIATQLQQQNQSKKKAPLIQEPISQHPSPVLIPGSAVPPHQRLPVQPPVPADGAHACPIQNDQLRVADILLGRGGRTNYHAGNLWYRELVSHYRLSYCTVPKGSKRDLAKNLTNYVRCCGGRFLERDKLGDKWYECGDERAILKCGQTLREGTAVVIRNKLLGKSESTEDEPEEKGNDKEGTADATNNSKYMDKDDTQESPEKRQLNK